MYTSTSQDLIDLLALGRAGGNLDMRREVGSGVGGGDLALKTPATCWQAIDSIFVTIRALRRGKIYFIFKK